ncbi:MAG: O-acetyl-ADP-ribose deacetylase [Clostridiaceae bacterium]
MSEALKENRIILLKGDLTKQDTDAIVNAANSGLRGGGGVDGAIHRAGGPAIDEECKSIISKIGRLDTGEAVITSGGNLKAKYVIHTVGPVWHGGNNNEGELLAKAYKNSLKVAEKNGIETIAFPNISTGIYGFPRETAARIAFDTISESLEKCGSIKEVRFVCFDDYNYELYLELMKMK